MTQLQRAARTGDKRKTLTALRVSVWESIADPKTGGRDTAALTKKWLELTRELQLHDRGELERLRDAIVRRIDSSNSGRDIAALSTRLIDVINEIDTLPDVNAQDSPLEKARKMVSNRGAA